MRPMRGGARKNPSDAGLGRALSSMAWLVLVRQDHRRRLHSLMKAHSELESIAKTDAGFAGVDAEVAFVKFSLGIH